MNTKTHVQLSFWIRREDLEAFDKQVSGLNRSAAIRDAMMQQVRGKRVVRIKKRKRVRQ